MGIVIAYLVAMPILMTKVKTLKLMIDSASRALLRLNGSSGSENDGGSRMMSDSEACLTRSFRSKSTRRSVPGMD